MNNRIRLITPFFLAAALLLGIKDGYIALWKDEDPQPWKILPLHADQLPETDQIMLEHGIRIRSEEELWELLEDHS